MSQHYSLLTPPVPDPPSPPPRPHSAEPPVAKPTNQALAKAAEAAEAAKAEAEANETEGRVPGAVKAIEAKLAGGDGLPPPTVAVALRADSASEGRRDVVRAMFEVAWWPMLGAFSQVCMYVSVCALLVGVSQLTNQLIHEDLASLSAVLHTPVCRLRFSARTNGTDEHTGTHCCQPIPHAGS